MKTDQLSRARSILLLAGLFFIGVHATQAADPGQSDGQPRVSLEVAQARAQLMHQIYSSTLETMHARYFHGERAIVPAKALEEVFESIEQQTRTKSRWISASLKPMSINHKPKTGFEELAAKKLAKGEPAVETIEDGYYRRAGSISLSGGCVGCHAGLSRASSPTPKFAGLIISVPVRKNARLPGDAGQTTPEPVPSIIDGRVR